MTTSSSCLASIFALPEGDTKLETAWAMADMVGAAVAGRGEETSAWIGSDRVLIDCRWGADLFCPGVAGLAPFTCLSPPV